MKKMLAVLLSVTILSAGCASRTANPIQVSQLGDETKSCRSIVNEIEETKGLISNVNSDGNMQVGKNVLLFAAGLFIPVLFLFMDLSNASTVENMAAQTRLKRLTA